MLTLHFQENKINTANLHLVEKRVSKISPLLPTVINITNTFEPERQRVEDFIKAIYQQSYGADIQVNYPVLMSVRNKDNDILAAVGFRYAENEPLFLEQYMDQPIEQFLGTPRSGIVEIGNLASAGHGASIFLFAALSSYLHHKQIKYAAITGTDFLHRYFQMIGLNPQKICDADVEALSDPHTENWGTYYDTAPRVLVGSVDTGVRRLKRTLGARFEDCRPRLFPRLHFSSKGGKV